MIQFSVQPNDAVTFKVHYEDEHLAVVGKPAGIVTQPGLGHEDDSLLNGLFARWGRQLQNLGAARDYGLLHRLDRETSGLLIVALNARAYDGLRSAFEARAIKKFYYAVVAAVPDPPSGVIDRPIAESAGRDGAAPPPTRKSRGPAPKKLARISGAGKASVTAYRVLASNRLGALVECRPVTGRLHQVRVHLASIGSPIIGDGLYAPKAIAAAGSRLALHAHRVVFTHPITGEKVDVSSGWPLDLKRVLKRLKLEKPVAAGGGEPAAPDGSDAG